MKVALVTSFPREAERPHGGVEAVSVNLVRGLVQRPDLEVHVVTADPGCAERQVTAWNGAKIHRLPAPRSSLLAFAIGHGRRQIQSYLSELRPDVVHAHDFYGLMVKGVAVPRVFTIHGFIHEDTMYGRGRCSWMRSRLWRFFETAAWADQPHIISISPYVRERLRGIARGVIHDVENPIAPECFRVRRAEVPGTTFSAGIICPRKNILGLVQAFTQLAGPEPDARLRLAGAATDPAYEKRVRDFIHTAGLTGRISLIGPIPAEQIRQELAQACIFTLVSFEEGAPMGIAEAMAAGVPVVTSNRCGMPYMVRHGETGFLVNPKNRDEIAGRLRELVSNPELRQRMGLLARQLAFDRFHPDRVAERTVTVYRQTAGLQRSAGVVAKPAVPAEPIR